MEENDRFTNQRGLIDQNKLSKTRFVVVGAGAIGSFFVTSLSKMGAKDIFVYDFDTLEDHNFANQMYPVSQLGKAKVDALEVVASDYGDCKIRKYRGPWTPDSARLHGSIPAVDILQQDTLVISAVDNMGVRSSLWNYYKDSCDLFIDGRMSALCYKVFAIDTKNEADRLMYQESLHSQAVAEKEPCGEKSIIFTVLHVASQMLNMVWKYLNGHYRPTLVIYDAFNDSLRTTHTMKQELETFTYIEEDEKETRQIKIDEIIDGTKSQVVLSNLL